ncbi:sigma factor [uncultured Pedobacter sp.]|uniref:sigma factor n=1 Tax=uncultured Pedobacter sp. TaxID=246139 RepID=UPI0025D36BAE|nr:sigma factor [uncultured Pedobacter sp.]
MQPLYQRDIYQELSIGSKAELSDDNLFFTTLQAYDGVAFKALYQKYSAAIYGNIIRYVNNEEKAKLILEQTFCEAWRSFPQFDKTKLRIFTWINQLALQTIRKSAL